MRVRNILFVVLFVQSMPALAQPPLPFPPRDKVPPPFEKLQRAREALRGLAQYPRPTREAILEISQYPELVSALAKERNLTPAKGRALAAQQGAKASQAAAVLAQSPEVLAILAEHLPLTTLLGVVYAAEPEKVREMADKLANESQAAEKEASSAWADKLSENTAAIEQLAAAIEAFKAEKSQNNADSTASNTESNTGTSSGTSSGTTGQASTSGESTTSGDAGSAYDVAAYGAVVSPNNAEVYGVPGYEFTQYVLNNANQYSDLASTMIEQYQSSQNQDSFQNSVGEWVNTHRGNYEKDFLTNPAGRAEQLRSGPPPGERNPLTGKNKFPEKSPTRKPTGAAKSAAGKSQGFPNTPKAPKGAAPKSVTPKIPNQPQQLARATTNHRGAWQAKPAAKPGGQGFPGKQGFPGRQGSPGRKSGPPVGKK